MLVDLVKPSITLGTESWLRADIADNEVFPNGYTCHRNDRNSHGGGVFILVEKSISSVQLPVPVRECEAIFCELTLSNKRALTVSSFYRPPDSSVDILCQLRSAVETIRADNLVIGGYFNLPHILWNDQGSLISSEGRLCQEMMNIVDLFALSQIVSEPSRGNHVLDLMFPNQPQLVISTVVVPRISDHSVVLCEMEITHVKPAHSVARPVYNYWKAQVDKINEGLDGHYDVFATEAEYKNTDELWTCLKNKMLELRQHFIPCRVLNERQSRSKPWFSKALRRLTNKRQRFYDNFLQVPSSDNRQKLKEISSEMKRAIRVARNAFSESIQLRIKDDPKQFWKLVKRNGKEATSIPSLVSENALFSDDEAIAEYFLPCFLL